MGVVLQVVQVVLVLQVVQVVLVGQVLGNSYPYRQEQGTKQEETPRGE
jgi:hypothetical protein